MWRSLDSWPFGLELYFAILGFSVTFASDELPKIETFNGWKLGNRGIMLDIQIEVSFFGIYLLAIEAVIFHKSFDYDLFFCLLGFGFSASSGD